MTHTLLATVKNKNSPVLLVHCTVVSHNPLKPASILHKMGFTSLKQLQLVWTMYLQSSLLTEQQAMIELSV